MGKGGLTRAWVRSSQRLKFSQKGSYHLCQYWDEVRTILQFWHLNDYFKWGKPSLKPPSQLHLSFLKCPLPDSVLRSNWRYTMLPMHLLSIVFWWHLAVFSTWEAMNRCTSILVMQMLVHAVSAWFGRVLVWTTTSKDLFLELGNHYVYVCVIPTIRTIDLIYCALNFGNTLGNAIPMVSDTMQVSGWNLPFCGMPWYCSCRQCRGRSFTAVIRSL